MDIPAGVKRCSVEGAILRAVLDTRDAGSTPDARALPDLRATVTATVPYIETNSGILVLDEFVFRTNQVGEIINPRSPDQAPEIVATDQNTHPEFRYRVQITWRGQTDRQRAALSWEAPAPAGGVLDLGRPIDPIPPEEIPEWERLRDQVLADIAEIRAAVEATGAAQAGAEAARDQAEAFRDQAGAIAAGEIIDDEEPSTVTVYSSQYTEQRLGQFDQAKAPREHTHSAGQITSGIMQAARLPSSTTAGRGIVELATPAEVVAGTDTSRAVTPAGLYAATGRRVVRQAADVLKGDGTDETTALASFLAGGGEMAFEPGKTYAWSGDTGLDIPAGSRVRMNGARLKRLGALRGGSYLVQVGERVRMDTLYLDMDGQTTGRAVYLNHNDIEIDDIEVIASNTGSGMDNIRHVSVYILGAQRIRIGRLRSHNWHWGPRIEGSTDVEIGRLHTTGHAVGLSIRSGCDDIRILSGTCDQLSPLANGNAGQSSILVEDSQNIDVSNFVSRESAEHAFRMGGQTASRNISYTNCIARNPGKLQNIGGCGWKFLGPAGLNNSTANYGTEITLTNCRVVDALHSNTNSSAFHFEKCRHVTATNLTVRNETTNQGAAYGIFISGCHYVALSNVTMQKITNYAIFLQSRVDGDSWWGGENTRINIDNILVHSAAEFVRVRSGSTSQRVSAVQIRGASLNEVPVVLHSENPSFDRNNHIQALSTGATNANAFTGATNWLVDLTGPLTLTPEPCLNGSTMRVMGGRQSRRINGAWVIE